MAINVFVFSKSVKLLQTITAKSIKGARPCFSHREDNRSDVDTLIIQFKVLTLCDMIDTMSPIFFGQNK